jgi:alpha-1,6-mannosyltransferase
LTLRMAFAQDVSSERRVRDIAMLLMAGLFFLSPNYPWYFLLVVPFIPLGGGAPAWALSIGAILLNLLYPDYDARFLLWKGVISLSFLIALVVTLRFGTPSRAPTRGPLQWTR